MAVVQETRWERTGKVLGRGSTGTVSLGTFKVGSITTPVAIKSAKGPNAVALHQEGGFLNHLRGCPQVIQCYGGNPIFDLVGDVSYDLLLEFVPKGSLYDFLQLSAMQECDARRFTRSMLRGLAHVHSRAVVHCDIKPANVLLWNSEEVKIADFGSAKWLSEENKYFPYRGTPYYLAPECLAKNEYRTAADVWALGCTVAEMFTCMPARSYQDVDTYVMLQMIARAEAMPLIPDDVSEVGKDFLRRCFEVDTRKRWTAEMLLQHPFVTDDVDAKYSAKPSAWEEKVAEIMCTADRMEQEASAAYFLPALEELWKDEKVLDVRLGRQGAMRPGACVPPNPQRLPRMLSYSF